MSERKILRVSRIAQLAWCQAKAVGLLRGDFTEAETENMAEGKLLHEMFGFNNTVSFTKQFGEYTIEGTPDYVGKFVIGELKVTRGNYPEKFLLTQAEVQANLYCWLSEKPLYMIFIYNTEKKDFRYFFRVYDVFRVQRDLSLIYCLLKGVLEPIPTRHEWKCKSCGYKSCKFRLGG
jgi:CRISPR/Cas system-associated exonuclease Cas4 (RecB family)